MEQIAIFEVLRRHAWMIVALCIIAAAAGYGCSFLLTEQYSASALVLVRPQQAIKIDTKNADKEFLDFPMGQSASVETPSKTYIEIIKSAELIGKVVRDLGLDRVKQSKEHGISDYMKEFLQNLIVILKYGTLIRADPFADAVKGVQTNLSLKALAETYVFEIKYTSNDPLKAAEVVNATASFFIDYMGEIRQSETRRVRDQLRIQLEQSRLQLETARQHLEDYKRAHSVFLYESEYNSKLKVIAELQIELAKAEEALVGSQNTLSNVSLAAKRALLSRLIAEREAELRPMPALEHELRQLEEDVKAAGTAYEIVDKEVKEADIKYSYAMPEVRLVSEAPVPYLPSSPARGIIGLASLLAGLVVGVILALLLEYLNRRVRGVHDIEDFVGIKVLGTIPRLSRRWPRAELF